MVGSTVSSVSPWRKTQAVTRAVWTRALCPLSACVSELRPPCLCLAGWLTLFWALLQVSLVTELSSDKLADWLTGGRS